MLKASGTEQLFVLVGLGRNPWQRWAIEQRPQAGLHLTACTPWQGACCCCGASPGVHRGAAVAFPGVVGASVVDKHVLLGLVGNDVPARNRIQLTALLWRRACQVCARQAGARAGCIPGPRPCGRTGRCPSNYRQVLQSARDWEHSHPTHPSRCQKMQQQRSPVVRVVQQLGGVVMVVQDGHVLRVLRTAGGQLERTCGSCRSDTNPQEALAHARTAGAVNRCTQTFCSSACTGNIKAAAAASSCILLPPHTQPTPTHPINPPTHSPPAPTHHIQL